MIVIVIDFETYYDKAFSLSKLTTEEYIRHPDFEVIGVSVKVGGLDTKWFSGTVEATKEWLDQFPWDEAVAVAHNAMFDMAILAWVFDIHPKVMADTLSMARAVNGQMVGGSLAAQAAYYKLGVKGTAVLNFMGYRRLDFTKAQLADYGEYCVNDTDLTCDLFHILGEGFPLPELRLIDLTLRMFTQPVLEINKDMLVEHLNQVRETKDNLLGKALITKESLMSNPKLAEVLRSAGVEPPTKISPTTGRETFAFAKSDDAFKALLEHDNPIVQAIVAARIGVKSTLEETRTERLIGISERGRMPVPLRYYAAHTGRWGGADKLNLQNLPRDSIIKNAIRPPDGYVVLDCDSSQIEARMLAWLAEQTDLVEAFDRGEDVYKMMASHIYDKDTKDITKPERFLGKWTILGCGYGMGALKFQAQLRAVGVILSLDECQDVIDVYRSTYPNIKNFWYETGDALNAMLGGNAFSLGPDGAVPVDGENGFLLPNGLNLSYPELRREPDPDSDYGSQLVYTAKRGRGSMDTKIYGAKAVENLTQALARVVIGQQMLKVAERYKVAMTVHDSVVAIAPKEEAEEALAYIEYCMRKRPIWASKLPLDCETKIGETYGE